MSDTLFERARELVLAHANDFFDKHENTPEGVKQKIRRVQDARHTLDDAIDEQAANIVGADREIKRLKSEMSEADAAVKELVTNTNPDDDAQAVTFQMRSNACKDQITEQEAAMAKAKDQKAKLDDMGEKLDAHLDDLQEQFQVYTQQRAETKILNTNADALENAADVMSSTSLSSASAAMKAGEHEHDVAQARIQRVLDTVGGHEDADKVLEVSRAAAQVDEIRRQIAEGAAAKANAPDASSAQEAAPATS